MRIEHCHWYRAPGTIQFKAEELKSSFRILRKFPFFAATVLWQTSHIKCSIFPFSYSDMSQLMRKSLWKTFFAKHILRSSKARDRKLSEMILPFRKIYILYKVIQRSQNQMRTINMIYHTCFQKYHAHQCMMTLVRACCVNKPVLITLWYVTPENAMIDIIVYNINQIVNQFV